MWSCGADPRCSAERSASFHGPEYRWASSLHDEYKEWPTKSEADRDDMWRERFRKCNEYLSLIYLPCYFILKKNQISVNPSSKQCVYYRGSNVTSLSWSHWTERKNNCCFCTGHVLVSEIHVNPHHYLTPVPGDQISLRDQACMCCTCILAGKSTQTHI